MEEESLVSKKTFLIFFAILIVVGLGAAVASRWDDLTGPDASPTPAPEELLFGDQQGSPNPNQITQPGNLSDQIQNSLEGRQQTQQNPQTQQRQIKQYEKFPGIYPEDQLKNKKIVIDTNKGIIEFELFTDSPKAASNFVFLTQEKFYDGLTFHRVEPGFVIQGGDPIGNGTGGPGYKFEDEPVTKKYNKGIVAMANSGPDTNGSQFFIMLENNPSLPPNYTIFGEVIKGQEVVDKITKGDVMRKVTIEEL
jgi:cyclophilin family peptidyl-prolyl cis-trans isomerase